LLCEDAWHRHLTAAAAAAGLVGQGWHCCVHCLPLHLQQEASWRHQPLCLSSWPPLPGSVSGGPPAGLRWSAAASSLSQPSSWALLLLLLLVVPAHRLQDQAHCPAQQQQLLLLLLLLLLLRQVQLGT
jgi:hypothetical protein